ncbi:hypothetical protein HY345_03765 [Candidatus Microgenomates bacterium]|nr:hypothetical protein [Candidatus Microgenomates bacterium]
MIDITQFVLLTVIVSLSVVLLIIGIHVIGILKELKISVQKTNKIIGDFGTVSESIAKPTEAASNFLMNLRGNSFVSSIVKMVVKRKLKKAANEDE